MIKFVRGNSASIGKPQELVSALTQPINLTYLYTRKSVSFTPRRAVISVASLENLASANLNSLLRLRSKFLKILLGRS